MKAFTVAAGPQMDSVTESWALYSAAQDAAKEGGEAAVAAQKAYMASLEDMTPATRDTATAFIGLKSDFASWSDEMSASTMPVFTQGIEILRDLLPTLTPFVQAAATALGGFLDDVGAGVKSAGFKTFAADLSGMAGPALTDFLAVVKNLGLGFGGLLSAFLPVSAGMTGGLADMTAGFAEWGQGLKGSEGFAQFLDMAATGGDTLGTLGSAAVNLLVALAPLIGTTAMLANGLAKIINSVPTPVLTVLAGVLVAVKVAMLANAAATAVVAAKNRVMALSQTPVILGWLRMQAVGVGAMLKIAATSTVSAARTAAAWLGSALVSIGTWVAAVVRAAVTAAAQFLLMAGRAVVWAATMAAQWLIAMGPIGWIILAVAGLVTLIIVYWDEIKAWTIAAWDVVWAKIKWFVDLVVQLFLNFTLVGLIIKHWDTITKATSTAWDAIVDFIKGIPGAIYNAFLNFTPIGLMIKHWSTIKDGSIRKAKELVGWVRGLPGMIANGIGNLGNLLYGKGQSVVSGLWNGIKSMGGWLRSTLMGWARNLVPGPIAKALGIASPSKYMADHIGKWIPAGVVLGIEAGQAEVDRTMAGLVQAPAAAGSMSAGQRLAGGSAPLTRPGFMPQVVIVRFDFGHGDSAFKTAIQKIVRVDGQGNVQTAFGR
ncbi:hypothetical protein NLX86_06700 [Streptomyces sp. A3M-1-3]|uniref:hypothetical protein n=1 Tax=Streptomyces sp. A3M-1-3 TaxID=2962044 RepID=UPI0020B8955F|nr:hypothetical protein [Streptomyces sp. A3M-1-3]MCP3817836.1 hypothetical protein [Streptomyces sp. A3M-1-3]